MRDVEWQRGAEGVKCRVVEFFFFFLISRIVGVSRLMETQMDLLRLLFGVGFQIFIVTPQMFTFSCEYVENVRG